MVELSGRGASVYGHTFTAGEIDWEHPGIHRGNLITCAGNRSGVFNQVKFGWTDILPLPGDYYIIAQIIIVNKSVYFYKTCYKYNIQ